MLYLLALFFPFLSVLFCGKPFQAALNLVIWCFGFATFGGGCVIAFIHAIFVIHGKHQDNRTRKIVDAINETKGYSPELTDADRRQIDEMVRRSQIR